MIIFFFSFIVVLQNCLMCIQFGCAKQRKIMMFWREVLKFHCNEGLPISGL